MAKKRIKRAKHRRAMDHEGIFIPAGLLLGMGLGFVYDNLPAGLFIGLGVGMAVYAIVKLARK